MTWYYCTFKQKMKNLRYRLVPLTAVAMYMLVHVLGPALHFHQVPASQKTQAAANWTVISSSSTDCDDEDHCPLCSVLHSAQVAPTISQLEVHQAVIAEIAQAAPQIRPNPIEAVTHSRAPPAL
jgi:hypothetical protein